MLDILWALLLVISAFCFWSLNIFGLPGNWFVVAAAALYAYGVEAPGRVGFSWRVVIGLILLAALGEVIEFAAGALGASKAGGSKRASALALIGSLIGGVMGAFVALPIPPVGPLIGALFFAALGALAGATLGEQWKGRSLDEAMQVGQAAFWGRLLGTLGKILTGAIMVVLLLLALVF